VKLLLSTAFSKFAVLLISFQWSNQLQVGGFSTDIAGFGVGCMSGLKPPTYEIPVNKIQTSVGRINGWQPMG
jgi:hypothetical protein